jgi:hypothetical protein
VRNSRHGSPTGASGYIRSNWRDLGEAVEADTSGRPTHRPLELVGKAAKRPRPPVLS